MSKQSSRDYDRVDQHFVDEQKKMTIPEHERKFLLRYKENADKGDVQAMVEVAEIYSRYKVYDEALLYYEMAVSRGSIDALARLAEMYFDGRGVSQDVNKGLNYYEQAADRGSLNAIWRLASIYLYGLHGVARDLDKVRKYYEKAVEAGDYPALHILALFYQGRDGNNKKIPGGKVDEAKAFNLLQKIAEENYEKSMYELGRCYRNGKGTPRDLVKAKEWFSKANTRGYSKSLFALAIMLVGETLTDHEIQTLDDLIESTLLHHVLLEWVQWYFSNPRVETADRQGYLPWSDDLDLMDATFLLARLLASTLDQDNLRTANKLTNNIKDQLDRHELLSWLSALVEDLCRENEEMSHVEQSDEHTFDMQKVVRPIALFSQGQFGKVYLAWYSDWGKFVAAKFVDIDLANKDHVLARNIIREQFTCRALKRNWVENTVQYLGYTDLLEQRKRGLVFELCADITKVKEDAKKAIEKMNWDAPIQLEGLPDWTKDVPSNLCSCVVFCKGSKWTTVQVIIMLRKAAEALLELHKLGFIHRDIAPRNILCDSEGNVQLANFGWAKFVGSSYDDVSMLTHYGKACFSDKHQYALAWWAPECFGEAGKGDNAIFSWNSDVYAFGITMWQCFAHKDPFSHEPNPDRIKNIILQGERPSLKKTPKKGGVLDQNTPDDLIALIDSCWKPMATERMKLAYVIKVIRLIETNLQNGTLPRQRRRAFKGDASQHWFDKSIHKMLKQSVTTTPEGVKYGGEYAEVQYIQHLQRVCHDCNTINEVISHVKKLYPKENPYDVFLVHAGEQKMNAVSTMKDYFEGGGLRCFVDHDMTPGSDPTGSMRFALTTCRYAVVVLSRGFFTKRHPASELMYAFERMQWIRKQNQLQGWDSLIVVLFNMKVEDYKTKQRADGIGLPDTLCSDLVLVEYSDIDQKFPWFVECLKLREIMIKRDNDGALTKWVQFLEKHSFQTLASDFPTADMLYSYDTK